MEKNEEDLPFLSDVIEIERFKKKQANLIIAPCHSGKTTAALKIMERCASCKERVLLLIDTTAGRDALTAPKKDDHKFDEVSLRVKNEPRSDQAQKYTDSWYYDLQREDLSCLQNGQGYRVMTYHQFGYKIAERPELLLSIDLIICDEMHNLLRYMGIEHAKNQREGAEQVLCCETAFRMLMSVARAKAQAPLLVIMTATANALSVKLEKLNVPYEHFDYTGKVHSDKTEERRYYSNLEETLLELKPDEKAIVYVPTIKMMLAYAAKIPRERNACCLWGLNNATYSMDEKQLKVRDEILNTKRIPEDIDILFINAAYETCINIENEDFNTMIIHCGNPDVQTQVRGRLRHDIKRLYLYDTNHEFISQYIPERFFDRQLFKKDTTELVELLNMKDENGRLVKWPTICKLLQKDGLVVQKIKKDGKRGHILRKAA